MISLGNTLKAAVLGIAVIAAAAVPVQKAHADNRGGAVIAGIAGGLILGSIIASTAKSHKGHHSGGVVKKHHYNTPSVSHSFGFKSGHRPHYYNGYHHGHRRHFGKRFFRKHHGHFGHRFHRGHRRGYYGY